MRVLIACEFSGTVRDAFKKRGHDAWSCDLLDTETPGNHYKGDVFEIISQEWDLMIAHPPCTYLSNSGVRWLKNNPERQELREKAVDFVYKLLDCNIEKIAIENPIGHLSTIWRKPEQIIQPFYFGEPHWKSTCLWLKNLPLLIKTNEVKPEQKLCGGAKPGRITSELHRLPPGKDRWKIRSKTYQGMASAMAEQWG
jgi:hypothetical protein